MPSSSANQLPPQRIVDRAAVVGIDQAQIPQLGSLIKVGNPGRGELEEGLGQRVDPARFDQRLDETSSSAVKLSVI